MIRYLMDSLDKIGCPFNIMKHFSCEPCIIPSTGSFHPTGDSHMNRVNVELQGLNDVNAENVSQGLIKCDPPIVLCSNFLPTERQVEETMIHELFHAYDFCRHKFNFEKDALQVACSEVRAANMSGDCRWTNEFMRGYVAFKGHHQVCVKRRALLSLIASPACQSDPRCKNNPQEFIDTVFHSCVKDFSPFVAMPY